MKSKLNWDDLKAEINRAINEWFDGIKDKVDTLKGLRQVVEETTARYICKNYLIPKLIEDIGINKDTTPDQLKELLRDFKHKTIKENLEIKYQEGREV